MRQERSLLLVFSREVEDFRRGNRLVYPSSSILFMSFVGVLCGAKEWEEVEEVCESCEDLLKEILREDFAGVPSHDTFNRFFNLISPEALEKAFRETMRKLYGHYRAREGEEAGPTRLATDGKYLNGVRDRSGVNMVSLYVTALGISLGQREAEKKLDEPATLRKLLSEMVLEKSVITADAPHCTAESARAIRDAKADYLLVVKKNQKHLYESIQEGIGVESVRRKERYISRAEETDREHGRVEHRVCYSCSHPGWLPDLGKKWEGIKSFGYVTCERTDLNTGKTSVETRCFISSTDKDAEKQMRWLREHWLIENHLHWHLDVSFGEDRCRMNKTQSKNFSLLRKLAMPVLKSFEYKKNASMKKKMLAAALKLEVRKKLILHALDFYSVP